MLTSVFYYNMYKPYIVGKAGSQNEGNTPRRARISQSNEPTGRVFVLNKALRNEVINYARAVSHGVTDLRDATKRTATDMENFNGSVHRDGWDNALENMAENLESFADNYNSSAGFMHTQSHSAGLRAYSSEVTDNVHHNINRLEMLGLTLGEEGRLDFNRETVYAMNHEQINVAIGENIEIFDGLRSHTQQLMTEPLSEHMRFSGLSYHYNYRMGTMETDGYSLIEAGMLVDRLV
ncbi:MAG: hypothetical protein FWB96_08780 [Defluviitaleaceae bacterium]|nr:hypothetical protein [Defluviitaleaceae bacterium]MCL2264115.1 hypothetical protein [Defluviitaleaceae bacterium]